MWKIWDVGWWDLRGAGQCSGYFMLATQQASASPAAAYYQPTTSQTLQVNCPTPTHPHASTFYHTYYVHVGGYTACGIPLVQSANRNRNRIPLNGILFNAIPFPFISIKKNIESSVFVHFH